MQWLVIRTGTPRECVEMGDHFPDTFAIVRADDHVAKAMVAFLACLPCAAEDDEGLQYASGLPHLDGDAAYVLCWPGYDCTGVAAIGRHMERHLDWQRVLDGPAVLALGGDGGGTGGTVLVHVHCLKFT